VPLTCGVHTLSKPLSRVANASVRESYWRINWRIADESLVDMAATTPCGHPWIFIRHRGKPSPNGSEKGFL